MKSVASFLWLLTLLLILPTASPAQRAHAELNYERDLTVTVATETTDPAFVYGKLTNKSENAYPCVRILFDLQGPAWREHIGTLPVYVQNLKANETRNYRQRLPFQAWGTFKYVGKCDFEGEDPANFPHIISFSVTPARIRRGQTVRLEWRTFNTDDALLAQRDRGRRPSVAFSGWKTVRLFHTTKFYLEAKKGAFSQIRSVEIVVR